MDETIGVKGGKNDRRRELKIRQARKKRLNEIDQEQREIRELEKKVRRAQIFTLIKTLPIVLGGGTVQTIYETAKGKKNDKEEENSKWKIKEYDQDVSPLTPEEFEIKKRKIITTPSGEKVVVYVKAYDVEDTKDDKKDKDNPSIENKPKTLEKSDNKKPNKATNTRKAPGIAIGDQTIDIESFIDADLSTVDLSSISPEAKSKINLIQSKQIIEGYEKELKEIRFELKKVIFEYNALGEENDEIVLSREAEIILEKLSELIDKVEELKKRIRLDNLDQYSGEYINGVVSGYIEELRDDGMIEEVRNSPLFITLSDKLNELEKSQGKFKKEVNDKKDTFEEREKEFERLKEKYFSIESINAQLARFQYAQQRLLREIQEKVDEAETVSEKVRIEFEGMNIQSRRLRRFLTFQMFFPGLRFGKGALAATAAYLYGMNQIIRPTTKEVPYKVIDVIDYHDEITGSISAIEDAIDQLITTGIQIDRLIDEIKTKFSSYLDTVPECRELLSNLKRIKQEINDKEEEMRRIKEQQEKELEKNDVKVKKRGEYPVN